VARTTVSQIFSNPSNEWVNGIYVFPLPENAAVDQLRMQVGERTIVGEIHPKREAKRIYEQAKAEGKKASLLEQQRTNMFTNNVANIGPGESLQVTIEYQQLIDYQSGQFSLRFPMTVAPRYLPENHQSEPVDENGWSVSKQADSHQETASEQIPPAENNVEINVALATGFALDEITSEFHSITQTKYSATSFEIKLAGNTVANRDFVLNWSAAASKTPQAAHFSQSFGDHQYGLIMLMPPQIEEQALVPLAREVIFILDTSGSMSGDSLYQAKTALFMAIMGLKGTDSFNLIEFNSNARALWSYSRAASDANKQTAREFVQGLEANGGTNMRPALEIALNKTLEEDRQRVRQVIFITDGSVGNDQELVNYITNNIADSRLFTVGIGAAPNSYFMREAAAMGKGSFTYIGSVTSVKEKMEALFSKLENPTLTELFADFSTDVEVYPRQLPDLYLGEPLLISYKTNMPMSDLYVSGMAQDKPWSKVMALDTSANQIGLNVLWARRKITQLTRDRMVSSDKDELKAQIENVAMQHHLVSAYTSLVAVDTTPTALDISHDRELKPHLPLSMNKTRSLQGRLPQTSTDGPLHLLFGLILMGVAVCIRSRQKNH
jgi:Ca-activated chloride channel family protein